MLGEYLGASQSQRFIRRRIGLFEGNGGVFFEGRCTPLGIGLFHQRQVEQPFAGIIDDVDMELARITLAAEDSARFNFQREAKLA